MKRALLLMVVVPAGLGAQSTTTCRRVFNQVVRHDSTALIA